MLTKIEKFIGLIKDTNEEEDYSAYTQIIKNERIRRNQTLEEMAKGICSVSYLSKLENNVIKPSEYYVKALLEKIDVDYDDARFKNYDVELNLAINYYFYEQYEKLRNVYNNIKIDHYDARVSLIHCLLMLVDGNYKGLKKEMSKLDEIKNSLVGRSTIVIVYIASEYYLRLSQYTQAYYYLQCLVPLEIYSFELNCMINEACMECCLHLNKIAELYYFYNKLQEMDIIGYPINRKLKITLLSKSNGCEFEAKAINEELYNLLNNEANLCYGNQIIYLVSLAYMKLNEFQKAIEVIEQCDYQNNLCLMAELGYCLDILNIVDKKEDFVRKAQQIEKTFDNEMHYLIVQMFKMKFENERSYQLYEYIRYTIMPYMNTHQHVLYNEYVEKIYIQLLIKLSRYKDAVIQLVNN